ncbi:hypothetical protein [Streptomyces sp. NBC_01353]|uniref:hypothetical protein n=1 Tax=Streptomyces sp. NBC_01353 TaxID=2903835 RepID=UPI002E336095|nr:hypothetical protein [Streptomyces sp. NBC_01353]
MIDRRTATNAFVTMLATGTALPVGRSKAPAGVSVPPYYVVDSMTTEVSGAPLADEHEDAELVYQVTSVSGPDPSQPESSGALDQAEWMADKARRVVLERHPATGLWLHALTIPGYKVFGRSLETEPGGTNDPAAAIISYVQRFRLALTPA